MNRLDFSERGGHSFKLFRPDGGSVKFQRLFGFGWEPVSWITPPAKGARYCLERSAVNDRLVVELTGEERDGGLVARLVSHESIDGSWSRPVAWATMTIRRDALGRSWREVVS